MASGESTATSERSIETGMVVAGRYRLVAPIGEGASATVWEAKHETLDRTLAVKFMQLYGRDVKGVAERFLREAKVAAAVRHRNVIDIVDFGQTEWGQPYMVMERLDGESLADRMDRAPPPTVAESLGIVLRVLSGLGAVHDAGIVHRDIKPENVFLVRDADGSYPKLLDFGISRATGESGLESVLPTREDLVVGTPQYMSPEQARGLATLDARSDLWSVGVLLFELLTGRLPFDAPASGDVLIKVVTEPAPSLEVLRPDLDPALWELMERALTKDPVGRFQSAREMREALLLVVGDAANGSMEAPISAFEIEREAFSEVGNVEAFELAAEEAYEAGDSGIITIDGQRRHETIKDVPPSLGRASTPAPARPPRSVLADTQQDPEELLTEEVRLKRRPFGAIALVVLGLLAAGGAGYVFLGPDDVPTPATTASPAAASVDALTWSVSNLPEGGRWELDGTPQSGESAQLARDGASHHVAVISRDGRAWSTTLTADQDRVIRPELPEPTAASEAAPRTESGGTRSGRRPARPGRRQKAERNGPLLRNPGF